MFLRKTRRYYEILESYRHPVTAKPTNRCVIRWPLDRTLDQEIAHQVMLPWLAVCAAERGSLVALHHSGWPWTKQYVRVEAILLARSAKAQKRLATLRRVRDELGGTGKLPRSREVLQMPSGNKE